jgi:AcrR family transcriptional regulator
MARKSQTKRQDLRDRLIDAAVARIEVDGLGALRARDLAAQAGCAVGAIYNVFDDMRELALAANGRTFRRMGTFVSDSLSASGATDPLDRLVGIGQGYLDFAIANPNAWRALFDVEMSVDQKIPPWYLEELERLFTLIAAPLAQLRPGDSREELGLLTRALFSSVHGIVLLGLERRISAVPQDDMRAMITLVIRKVAAT